MNIELFTPRIIDLFWSNVDKNGPIPDHRPELGQCWIWTGFKQEGYGSFKPGSSLKGARSQGAHRISYFLSRGPFDWKLMICHHCDNPSCVRPEHLFAGTAKMNIEDCVKKGRRSPDIGRYKRDLVQTRAKLTFAQIDEIKGLYASGKISQFSIAEHFGVCQQTISNIIKGIRYVKTR